MGIAETLTGGFNKIVTTAGKPVRIRYYAETTGSVYDDEVVLTEMTGSEVWTSGVVMSLNSKFGSTDVNLVEQGKLSTHDQALYVNGSLDFTGTGSNIKVKVGMTGSPIQEHNYTLIPLGGNAKEVQAIPIYKKAYIRLLPTGSLVGEV